MTSVRGQLERRLKDYFRTLQRHHRLKTTSPLLFSALREFALREGKRVRPTLFVVGYRGYCRRCARGLLTSALSLELLHDFMLVHDDIIDKSDLRRGKPALHRIFQQHLKRYRGIKFNGTDLAIIAGDVLFAMALHSFLAIREAPQRKEEALKLLFEAALRTGSGEFIELISGARDIAAVRRKDIEAVYDFKTAYYTFAYPLMMGAVLGGARRNELRRLGSFGIYLGRAFQIKDDIIGMFSEEEEIGKSILSDLQEAKKTLLLWTAYRKSPRPAQQHIRRILSKTRVTRADLMTIRGIVTSSGALQGAKAEIALLRSRAQKLLEKTSMRPACKSFLRDFSAQVLRV